MIKALYSVSITFLCNDAKVLEELLTALHHMAGMYKMDHTFDRYSA